MADTKLKGPPPPGTYPKWRYHASHDALIVQNVEDEANRAPDSDGWVDHPDKLKAAAAPKPATPPHLPAPSAHPSAPPSPPPPPPVSEPKK